MITYNCICFDCPGSGRFKVQEEGELVQVTCPECESKNTKVLGQESGIFGKIGSMTLQEKQKVLKKRSNEHFKSKLKEKKEFLDRSILGLAK